MDLSERQEAIVNIVRDYGPITGKDIASRLHVTRSALRSDLTVLTMLHVLDARPKVGYFYIGHEPAQATSHILHQFVVEDVLSQAIVVTPTTSLYDTIVSIFTEDVGTILVAEEGNLQGIVSRKDLLRATMGQTDPHALPISMIMTPVSKVIYVNPKDSLVDAAQKMAEYEVDCLPVLTVSLQEGKKVYKIIGRVSKTTVVKVFLECSRK